MTDENRDGIFKFGSTVGEAMKFGANGFSLAAGAGRIDGSGVSGIDAGLDQLLVFFAQVDGVAKKLSLLVEMAKRKVVAGDFRFCREDGCDIVGCGSLGESLLLGGGSTDPAPEIDFVIEVEDRTEAGIGINGNRENITACVLLPG